MQHEGRISYVSRDRGYHFIACDDGQSYFAHVRNVEDERILDVGTTVSFVLQVNPRNGKTEACRVKVLP
jgi:cold shock CspA family protein